MKRSFFLVSLGTVAVASAAPRLAAAQSTRPATHIRRRVTMRRSATPGGCSSHRRGARWAGFTAADFAD